MDNGNTRINGPVEDDPVLSGITEPEVQNPDVEHSIYSGYSSSREGFERAGSKVIDAKEYLNKGDAELNPDILQESAPESASEDSTDSTSNIGQQVQPTSDPAIDSPIDKTALKEGPQFVKETDKIIKFMIKNLAGDGYEVARRANSTFLTNVNGNESKWIDESRSKAA